MKKLFLLLALLWSALAWSQNPVYQTNNTNFNFGNHIKVGKSFILPNDTLAAAPDSSMASINTVIYKKIDGIWRATGLTVAECNSVVNPVNISYLGTGFDWAVAGGGYNINCTPYPAVNDTLTNADPDATFDRYDAFYLDETGVHIKAGTPEALPIVPSMEANEIFLAWVLIPAASTGPAITSLKVYDENTEGWTITNTGTTTDPDNTTNVLTGAKSLNITNINHNDVVRTIKNTGSVNLATSSHVSFGIRLKANMPTSGNLVVAFLQNGVLASGEVTIPLNKTNLLYQPVAIPLSVFNLQSFSINQVRFRYLRPSNGATYTGAYIDDLKFVEGLSQTPAAGVSSVTLQMPSIFGVTGSPGTGNVDLQVTMTGPANNYIKADGTSAAFPTIISSVGDVNGRAKSIDGLVIDGTEIFGQDADTDDRGFLTADGYNKLWSNLYLQNAAAGDTLVYPFNDSITRVKVPVAGTGIDIVSTDTTLVFSVIASTPQGLQDVITEDNQLTGSNAIDINTGSLEIESTAYPSGLIKAGNDGIVTLGDAFEDVNGTNIEIDDGAQTIFIRGDAGVTIASPLRLNNLAGAGVRIVTADAEGDLSTTAASGLSFLPTGGTGNATANITGNLGSNSLTIVGDTGPLDIGLDDGTNYGKLRMDDINNIGILHHTATGDASVYADGTNGLTFNSTTNIYKFPDLVDDGSATKVVVYNTTSDQIGTVNLSSLGGITQEQSEDFTGAMFATDNGDIDFTYNDGTPDIAATIKNDAVSYGKMQNVSAASKLLGRGDSGSGDVQEITLGTGLTMTGTTLSASSGGGFFTGSTATGSTIQDADGFDFTLQNVDELSLSMTKMNFSVSPGGGITHSVVSDGSGNWTFSSTDGGSTASLNIYPGSLVWYTSDQSFIINSLSDQASFTKVMVWDPGSNNVGVQDISGLVGASYTDEQAQDAIGAMINASLQYVDGTPLLAIADRDFGDLTTSGSGLTMTIDNLAVTNAKINDVAWSKVTSTPTTLSGYGITDALSNSSSSTQDGYFGTIKLRDITNPSHYLTVRNNEDLTAGRTLNIVTGDADRTLTLTGNASITGTNTGDQTSVTGNAGTATALQTARNIQGVAFDGTADINPINGTGFVKVTGTTLSYDNSTYLTTASAASTYQPLDADLTTISGLTATTDNFIVSVASAWASRTPAQVRTTLALVPGSDVQAYDADLTTYAGITPSANVQTLLGAANYSAFKTSLSLNNVENTALSTWAGTSNITTLGTITTGTISTGSVIGGTTMTLGSDANYDVYYRNSSGVLTRLGASTDGYVLTTHSTSSPPTWEAPGGGGLSASNFVFGETPSGSINGSNVTFTLANTPTAATVRVFLNGIRLKVTEDYTISSGTITMNTAPITGDILITDYLK